MGFAFTEWDGADFRARKEWAGCSGTSPGRETLLPGEEGAAWRAVSENDATGSTWGGGNNSLGYKKLRKVITNASKNSYHGFRKNIFVKNNIFTGK
jgi:hypothetical protein